MLAIALFIAVWLGLTAFAWWPWLGNGGLHSFWKIVLLGAIAFISALLVAALVYSVPWEQLVSSVHLPMPAVTSATPTPQVIERVVEASCPEEPLEKYSAKILRGEMNCPIEGSTDSVTPGQDRPVNGMLLSCEICTGKPHLVVKGYVPTPTPAPVVPSAGSQSSIVDNGSSNRPAGCKTDAEMEAIFGLNDLTLPVFTGENVVWDFCKWNLQSPVEGLPLPAGWQITARMDRSIKVFYGPLVQPLNVLGGTIRQLDVYNTSETKWAQDKCEMLKREDAFGMNRTPAYHSFAGNFSCDNAGTKPTAVPTAKPAVTPTPAAEQNACAGKDATWMAANIGGDKSKWTAPDWVGGAWVFKDKGHSVPLKYPAGSGKLDVWLGQTSITSANADALTGKVFDEASFHCQ